ncbi:hypothetical protein SNE40_012914 [Patella caerulea]|uniref:Sulfotransferase domain-containing protein n=1 Tax=Patella caerulea TaxID=87958 RepID=A0AAN8JL93_PATCE
MSVVKVPDASGKTITLLEWDGRLYPEFPLEAVMNVPSFKLRDDDILLCSYATSGTHWMSEICRMLIHGRTDIEIKPKEHFMLELKPQATLDNEPSPRILNTHYRFDRMPTDLKTKKTKIVYIRRNPKDVVVSFYNHTFNLRKGYEYEGEFKDYFESFLDGKVDYGSWFEYVKDWEKTMAENPDLPILDCTYEDLKEDPIREIRRLADFLGVEKNENLFKSIAESCNIDSMRARFKGHFKFLSLEDGEKTFCRKGETGDWKNWFTVAQNERFDQIYKQRMADSKLKFKFTL